jgi:adenylosuccinate lyase
MIPRYSRPDMVKIFEEDNKFKIWLEVETLVCEKLAEMGTIPSSVPKSLREKGDFNKNRILEIEETVKHDVIAFLTNLAEYVGEDAKYVHQGMTSSDLIDTSFAIQLTQAVDIILEDLDQLLSALKGQALAHKDTLCIGRSHGIHAEPTTFGLKLSGHYAAFLRSRARLEKAREEIAVCMISGAVGTYATISPEVEEYVADRLGLKTETVSTQVIPRDRHANLFLTLGLIGSLIENLATEIRHLQRSEVREAEEFFSKGQKGSSAMPHKRNPILTENLTGLARLVRSSVVPSLENVTLWHERDISHSSVERVIAPDTFITLDFALARLTNVVKNLVVYPDRMLENLNMYKGLVFSQKVLLELTQNGLSREESYALVQRNAMKVWDSNDKNTFLDHLLSDSETLKYISEDNLKSIFDYSHYTRYANTIFERVFSSIEQVA